MLELPEAHKDPGQGNDETAKPSALVVGKITQPKGLWTALNRIAGADNLRNGVLIVFSKDISGRIGIFCNRYISGAVLESTWQSGPDAVSALLSVTDGMFGFRPCLGIEGSELGQSLAIDINELLSLGQTHGEDVLSPSDALAVMNGREAPAKTTVHFSDYNEEEMPEFDGYLGASGNFFNEEPLSFAPPVDELPANAAESLSPPQPTATTESGGGEGDEGSFSYLDWFSDQVGVKSGPSKVREILMPALPQKAEKEEELEPLDRAVRDMEQYDKMVQAEHERVIKDIERSLQKHEPEGSTAGQEAEAVNDLRLFRDLLALEHDRVKTWSADQLNAIPTPKSAGAEGGAGDEAGYSRGPSSQAVRGGKEFLAGCTDLIQSTSKPVQDAKTFVNKKTTEEVVRPPQTFGNFFLDHPKILFGVCASVVVLALVGVVQYQAASDTDACFNEGKAAFQKGELQDARLLFTQTIEKNPNFARAYFLRAMVFGQTGEPEKALADLNIALSMGMSKSRVMTSRASVYAQMHDCDKAIDDCNHVILADPNYAEAYQIRALCRSHQSQFEACIKDCDAALKFAKEPEVRARLLLERGFAEGKLNQWAEAAKDFGEAAKTNPTAAVFMQRADAYRDMKKFPEALADYSKVIELEPRSYDAYVARGIAEAHLKKNAEALHDFGRALDLNKNGVEALIQRGEIHLAREEWRLAANDLEDSLELNPNIQESKDQLALAYKHLNRNVPSRYAGDVDIVRAKTVKLPSDPKAIMDLGYSNMNNGAFDEAIICFSALLKQNPADAAARKYLAYCYFQSNQSADAAFQFGQLQRLHALDHRDTMAYGKSLALSGQYAAAVTLFNAALQKEPNADDMRIELAKIYASAGAKDQSVAVCKQGIALAKTAQQRSQYENFIKAPDANAYNATRGKSTTDMTKDVGG